MNLEMFVNTIEQLFKKELLKEFYDDYGFTNTSKHSVKSIGYATNLSIETIEEAARNKVDLMVTHHDAWDFLYEFRDECFKRLIDYNISHFYIHGPLDFVEFGTCTSLMKAIGIDSIKKYSCYQENREMPGVGEFIHPIDFWALKDRMMSELNEPVRAWKNNEKQVKRIAVLTGAGHSTEHMKFAIEQGCDTYITGEASLYSIQYAQFAGINLIVGSHTFTEIFGVENLAKKIKERHNDLHIVKLQEQHFELNSSLSV